MTENDKRLAVIAVNQALATNNPKGLTDALRLGRHITDGRFDIVGYETLNKALLELYLTNPDGWAAIVKSVPFNYQKTDDSTSPDTRVLFQNISTSIDSTMASSKGSMGKWFDNAIDLILGSTTTTTVGGTPLKPSISPWVYAALTLLGIGIVALIIFAIKKV